MNKLIRASRKQLNAYQDKLWKLCGISSYRLEVSELTGVMAYKSPENIEISTEIRDNVAGSLMTVLDSHPENLQRTENRNVINMEICLEIIKSYKQKKCVPPDYFAFGSFVPTVHSLLTKENMVTFLNYSSSVSTFLKVDTTDMTTDILCLLIMFQAIAIGLQAVAKAEPQISQVTRVLLNSYFIQPGPQPESLNNDLITGVLTHVDIDEAFESLHLLEEEELFPACLLEANMLGSYEHNITFLPFNLFLNVSDATVPPVTSNASISNATCTVPDTTVLPINGKKKRGKKTSGKLMIPYTYSIYLPFERFQNRKFRKRT